ncbi:MAG: hypothetical protein HYR51_15175 [Candidatus Rokubacteria bacterium]|nr:hypothetical protein [Candidatus Rokubacteria bacterium]
MRVVRVGGGVGAERITEPTPKVAIAAAALVATPLPLLVGVFPAPVEPVFGILALALVVLYLRAPRHRRWIEGGVLALLSLALSLTVVELVLRPFAVARVQAFRTERLPELPIVERFARNVSLAGPVVGDLALLTGVAQLQERREVVFRSDAFGFRNDEVPAEVDVLLLGDSFGVGVVSQEHTIRALLASATRRRVYDLSQPRTGPWVQYVNLLVEAPRLTFARDAHVVWLLYTGNDLLEPNDAVWRREELPWRGTIGSWWTRFEDFRARAALRAMATRVWLRFRPMIWRSSRAAAIVGRMVPGGVPVVVLREAEDMAKLPLPYVTLHPNWPPLRRTLSEAAGFLRARGVRLTVVVLPTKGEVYRWLLEGRQPGAADAEPSGFATAVLTACTELRIACEDAKPRLVREAQARYGTSGEFVFWRDDSHLNRVGNQVVVDLVTAVLDRR